MTVLRLPLMLLTVASEYRASACVRSEKIFALLKKYAKNKDTAVVVVTHNPDVAELADHVIKLRDGKIVADERVSTINAE